MGKFPKISGNTESKLDKKTGVVDLAFDVYVYQNSGATDNAERANIIVCIVNNAADGSSSQADLGIDRVEIHQSSAGVLQECEDGTNNTNASEGWILDPTDGSGTVYIGAPEKLTNKAATSTGQSWKSGDASVSNAYVTHPGTTGANTIASNLGTTPTDYNIVPLYTCHTLTDKDVNGDYENPIPAHSWAAFVIAYEPTAVEALTGVKLKIYTNAGDHFLNLDGTSFDEVVMAGNVGSINGSTFTPTVTTINDGGTWYVGNNSNGCYPRAASPALLRAIMGDNVCLKVTDVSQNQGTVGWKWKYAKSTANVSTVENAAANEDYAPTAVPDSYPASNDWNQIQGGLVNLWVAPENMESMWDQNLQVDGTSVTGMSSYSQYPIGKNFKIPDTDTFWHDGSYHNITGMQNYTKNSFFQSKYFYLKYETNPDNYVNADLGNQLYTFAIAQGVYTKITTSEDRSINSSLMNVTTAESFAAHVNGAGYGHKSYRLPSWIDNGSEFDLDQEIRYNNWANDATYGLAGYDFAAAVNESTTGAEGGRFAIKSVDGWVNGKNPYQWSVNGSNYNTNTFNAFESTNDTTDIYLRWNILINRTAGNLYANTTPPFKFDRISTDYHWDFDKIQYYTKPTDRCWDQNGDYPGLKSKLYWNYVIPPTLSRISLVPKNNNVIDQNQGSYIAEGSNPDLFDDDLSARVQPELVTQWYTSDDHGQHAHPNESGAGWENNMFSGTNGKAHYDDASRNAGNAVAKVAAWQEVNDLVNSTDAATNNPVYRGYVDSNNNRIKEFHPVDVIYKLDPPSLSPNDGNYYSFGAFRFFNHGDDVIYIHSMKIVMANDDDDIFEVRLADNPTGDPSNPTETNLGYKPNSNSADPEWTISEYGSQNSQANNNDPWRTSGASALADSGLYSEKKYYTTHTASTQNTPIENYRQDTGNLARYCSPVRKWFDVQQDDEFLSESFDNLEFGVNDAQDNYGIITPTWDQLGILTTGGYFNGTRLYEVGSEDDLTNGMGGSQTVWEAPVGDSLFLIRFKLDPTETVHDEGTYRAKLVVFTYTHEYANRYKVQPDGTAVDSTFNFDNWEPNSPEINLKLEEHHFYFKTTVEPSPVLQVMDVDDNQDFPDNYTVDVGAINIG